MNWTTAVRTALSVSLILLVSCSTVINPKADFRLQNFEVGRTTRSELIEAVGLPQEIVKDADGREHFFYEDGPRYIRSCAECVGTVTVPTSSKREAEKIRKNSAEYVFDERSILVEKREPVRK